jgi:hypothetical protein
MSDFAMVHVGGSENTIKVASEAIIAVLKAAGTEAASVAAMNTLSELARAPTNTTISNCKFTHNPPVKSRRK